MTILKSKINFFSALLLMISLFTINARADESPDDSALGLFLEPAVTYERGDTFTNYPSPLTSSSGSADGFGLGARVGIHLFDSFFLGMDGRYSMPQFKDSSIGYDARSVSTNWGPVVGMQMPIVGLRIWGSYILGGEFNPKESGNFDLRFKNARGYRLGAGFKLFIVSLNLEYQQLKYDHASLERLGPFSLGSNLDGVQLENDSWIASVSFPLAL